MAVTDAITIGGDAKARHAFHETGGKPPKATIAQGRIGFQFLDEVKIDIEFAVGLFIGLREFEIAEGIAQQPTHQKFEREIINPLGFCFIGVTR